MSSHSSYTSNSESKESELNQSRGLIKIEGKPLSSSPGKKSSEETQTKSFDSRKPEMHSSPEVVHEDKMESSSGFGQYDLGSDFKAPSSLQKSRQQQSSLKPNQYNPYVDKGELDTQE